MGKLAEISITERGEIQGIFTNGQTRDIATILLAEFINPAGLLRCGNSMWAESNNSGMGVLHKPTEGTASTIKPGALEMSNVDLAAQFVDMIVTQRGFQANSRTIQTSDQMLQEILNLR
jgi:flagellar hook protein FlgE